ncbi:hypothetical protein BSKO_10552 [Bryopsis sp. KO-2023]|nr:hypothetical protein BSKO_10552 [Bryopsis sp. KO-2023]
MVVAAAIAFLAIVSTCSAEWDYIVVGAGASGCASAGGLAEDGSSVLVVEAGAPTTWDFGGRIQQEYFTKFGGDTDVTVFDVPGEALGIQSMDGYWWDTIPWGAQGKGVGGSGAMNLALAFQPSPDDFDDWPPGWQYPDMQPFFEEVIEATSVSATPSTDGKLYNQAVGDVLDRVATNQLGFEKKPLNEDVGARGNTTSLAEFYIKGGQRFESCLAFLLPSINSGANLKLMTGSMVSRIIFDKVGQASGVQLEDGTEIMLNGGGKLVLAAGPFNTPKLLMYSGIGPASELERLDMGGMVENSKDFWVANEELGISMHDHVLSVMQIKAPDDGTNYLRNLNDVEAQSDYFNERTNALTQSGVVRMAFLSKPGLSVPAIEIAAMDVTFGGPFPIENCASCFEVFILPLKPASRGDFQIKTDGEDCGCGGQTCKAGDFCMPEMYLSTQGDVEELVWAIKTVGDAFEEEGFEVLTPGSVDEAGIRSYIESDPRSKFNARHYAGSCALGRCTDADLKVEGTENVFVVDSSVFPTPVRAHNVLTAITVGRKAVGHIKSA